METSDKAEILQVFSTFDESTLNALLSIKTQFTAEQLKSVATKLPANKNLILKFL